MTLTKYAVVVLLLATCSAEARPKVSRPKPKPIATATPPPTPTPVPSNKPTHQNGLVCRTEAQDAALRDWIIGIQTKSEQALRESANVQKFVSNTSEILGTSQTDLTALELSIARLKAEFVKTKHELEQVTAKLKETTTHLVRLRLIVAMVITILVCLLILRLKEAFHIPLSAVPYLWIAYIAGPVLIYGAVYSLLLLI